jgi:putative selenium metabolism protein SsnA
MLITHARVVTWGRPNQILEDHALRIEGDRIVDVMPQSQVGKARSGEEVIEARGQLVMPGNICAHTHFYGAFARGLAIPGAAPRDFPEILRKLWWPLDKSLETEDVRLSALVCLVDAVKHGTTTLIDHHASPNALAGSLDAIAEAVTESGLRAALCYEVSDRDGLDKARAGIEENLRFLRRCQGGQLADGRIAATFGLHASLTLSEETLEACRRAAPEGTGFHIHVAEHEADEYDSLARSGLRIVDRLQRHGILGSRTIVAHAIHVDAREVQLLGESGTWVTHQPRSNMNNGVGAAPVESLMRAGVRVALGNDGFSNAMWEEWKAAYLLHKVWHRDPRRMPGDQVVEMAVYRNAELAGGFFPQAPLGVIAPGALADLILVDYHPATPLTAGNLFHESRVTTTIAAGKVLMRDRVLLTLNEAEIAAAARARVPAVWERYRSYVPADQGG